MRTIFSPGIHPCCKAMFFFLRGWVIYLQGRAGWRTYRGMRTGICKGKGVGTIPFKKGAA